MSVMDDAQILWDYHQMHHEPRSTDIAIGLGSHDIGVAEHAAELRHEGRFPLIVFTGGNAPTTVDVFPRGEAVHYSERAQQLGVPADAIVTETRATNTGENFTLTRELLNGLGLHPASATVISRPYQQRRLRDGSQTMARTRTRMLGPCAVTRRLHPLHRRRRPRPQHARR